MNEPKATPPAPPAAEAIVTAFARDFYVRHDHSYSGIEIYEWLKKQAGATTPAPPAAEPLSEHTAHVSVVKQSLTTQNAPSAAECAARKAMERLLKAASESGTCCDSAVIPNGSALHFSIIENQEFDDACEEAEAALAAPCECQRLREENEHLRRRIHQSEGHNQFFERCESAWCNPDQKNNPASEGVGAAWKTPAQYDAALTAAKSENARLTEERDEARAETFVNPCQHGCPKGEPCGTDCGCQCHDEEPIRYRAVRNLLEMKAAENTTLAAELRQAVDALRVLINGLNEHRPTLFPVRKANAAAIIVAYDAKHGEGREQ